MSLIDTTPIYNLKAVVRETGLKADTLRAWERRYNLITPHRTPKGHRLYTRENVEYIKQILELLEQSREFSRFGGMPEKMNVYSNTVFFS